MDGTDLATMSKQESENDHDEEYRERIKEIIEEDRELLDRLA